MPTPTGYLFQTNCYEYSLFFLHVAIKMPYDTKPWSTDRNLCSKRHRFESRYSISIIDFYKQIYGRYQTVSNNLKFYLTSGNKPILKDSPSTFVFAKVPGPKTVWYFFHTQKYFVYMQYIFVWTTVLIGVGPETQTSLIRVPLWSHTW